MKVKVFTLVKLITLAAVLLSATAWVQPAKAQADCGDKYSVVKGDTLFKISLRCGTTVNALMRANPHIRYRNLIYPGQVLVLPGAIIPDTGSQDIYIIKRGDTLRELANRFDTTVARLLELNPGIGNANLIYEGQRLAVPISSTPDPQPGQTYVVHRGDTLRKIAARFDTTVDVLLKLNPQIKNANLIYNGQRLVLPESVTIYMVVRGDTLRMIAAKYDTTVAELMKLNPGIKNANLIYPGQVIRIR
ncbi:MAG: LysM peptidoglycan-binding domain-containing protein [Anaerolineales bacterium]|nr:LysM peptidoglycan-binding domain-containing protein [Anaerolineales bacterium]